MIVFLEGVNGAGKSAYAKALAKRLGWPTYRAFKKGTEHHVAERLEFLEEVGIQVNSHVDDVYMADFFSTFKLDAIIDRTFTSALAYDTVYDEPQKSQSAGAFKFWLGQLKEFDFLYVWLEVDYETAAERRSGFHPSKKEHKALAKAYGKAFQRMPKPKMRISTDSVSIEDGVELICQRLTK